MTVPTLALPDGRRVPVLGQGTWKMGERANRRREEVAALRLGLDLGMTLIDTAEMYGEGGAEEIVGEAIAGRRDETFIVSKVYPHNASRRGVAQACERSLRRMRIERIDLYLLHWRGGEALRETVAGFGDLMRAGKIAAWGVSNFDADDMAELATVPGGDAVAVNQVIYNLSRRGIEFDPLPGSQARGMPIMAYSPIEQGRLLRNATLGRVAARHQATPAQVALAWVLRQPGVMAIPKAAGEDHVRENRGALDVTLTAEDFAALDAAFPPPKGKQPLEML